MDLTKIDKCACNAHDGENQCTSIAYDVRYDRGAQHEKVFAHSRQIIAADFNAAPQPIRYV